jgi:hypothetical protein
VTDDEARVLWLYMTETWSNYALPATEEQVSARLMVWRDLLGDMAAQAVRAAIMAHSREPFPPTPGALRATAERLLGDASGHHIPDVDEAWAEVRQATARGFQHPPAGWSHPAVRSAVEALGWWRLCYDENETALAAQFRDLYRPAAERAERYRALPTAAEEAVAALVPAQPQVVVSLSDRLAERTRELEP